jgi:hypothetical protein
MKVSKNFKVAIYERLNNSDLMNIFGLVNISCIESMAGAEKYTREELRQAVIDLFDDSVIGGVQFKDEPRIHPVMGDFDENGDTI